MVEKKESGKSVKWIIITLALLLIVLALYAAVTVYIDPLFHYHAPLEQYQYPIEDHRYQGDGILRNFEYGGLIIGTSITEQFKTSEAEQLWGVTFVKTPFAGAHLDELHDRLSRALRSNNELKYVLCSLDTDYLLSDTAGVQIVGDNPVSAGGLIADASSTDLPEYLYNNNIFDDVYYLFNKELFARTLRVIEYTRNGSKTPSFDDIALINNSDDRHGADVVLNSYTPPEIYEDAKHITDTEIEELRNKIQTCVVDIVEAYPNVEFYLFFPPYSICYWDVQNGKGMTSKLEEAQQVVIEELLPYDNVKLFGFDWDHELVCDLNYYYDKLHYTPDACSRLLQHISQNNYLITEDNYAQYLADVSNFYHNYDYAALHALKG